MTSRSPCHPMMRLFMGIKESPYKMLQNRVPDGFNGTNFLTLRYRWPQNVPEKPGKCFVDLSRVDPASIHARNTNPHRTLKTYCRPGFPVKVDSPFLVYHYAGSFEQFSYRLDGRNSRTREVYNKRYYDNNSVADDTATFWLREFVNHVGTETARILLEGVGVVEKLNASSVSARFSNSRIARNR